VGRRNKKVVQQQNVSKRKLPLVKTVVTIKPNLTFSVGQEIETNGQKGTISKIDHVLLRDNSLIIIGEIEVNV
jgi:hypothetical protein